MKKLVKYQKPLVSVIIPTFNVERYIRQCIESILNNSYDNIEIIVVDDMSTDSTVDILHEYKRKYDFIHLIENNVKMGGGGSRNAGISLATGKYIYFCDSDDWINEQLIEKCVIELETNDAQMCVFNYTLITNDDKQRDNNLGFNKDYLIDNSRHIFNKKTCKNIFAISSAEPWNKMFLADYVKSQSEYFQEIDNCNDISFIYRLMFFADKITYVDEHLYFYRFKTLTSVQSNKNKTFETSICQLQALYHLIGHIKNDNYLLSGDNVHILIDFIIIQLTYFKNTVIDKVDKTDTHIYYDKVEEFINYIYANFNVDFQDMHKLLMFCHDNKYFECSFSIILPTYNRSYCICDAIDSVLAQSYQNYELLVIDDGSTDKTIDILNKKYKSIIDNEKIKIISIEKSGVSAARNIGLEKASKKWICYIDSDNKWHSNFLEIVVNAISQNRKQLSFYISNKHTNFSYDDLLLKNYIDMGLYIHHVSLIQFGKFDINLNKLDDWDLILQHCHVSTPKKIYVDELPYFYNSNKADSSRITTSINYQNSCQHIYKKYSDFPLISILVISYNQEAYLKKCLNSAIQQKMLGFQLEIVIADDNSTDNSKIIIDDYASKYPDLVRNVSDGVHRGLTNNYKFGIKHCNGIYISLLEADDTYKENNVYEKFNFMIQNKDCGLVFSKCVTQNGIVNEELQNNLPNKISLDNFSINKNDSNIVFNLTTVMFKKHVLYDNNGFELLQTFSEKCLIPIFLSRSKIGFINKQLTTYYTHDDSVWNSLDANGKKTYSNRLNLEFLNICSELKILKTCI